jgi:2-oxoisovalerate dehydrogenase E2 component (dihydrolipoyl transacylase)
MSNLMVVRNMLKDEAMKSGVKLTFMPFLIKAASESLKQFPILNSNLDAEKMTVHYKSSHNVSVAIHTPAGLVVPNVKDCQTKSILEIARELNELQEKGQKGTLTPADFANGTFSLSNIGVIGGTYTHPCIMPPQVAIGAVGKISKVPRFGPNDEVVAANIMIVTWCADHRIIDGVTMASFSNLWKNYLENPNLFMLTSH